MWYFICIWETFLFLLMQVYAVMKQCEGNPQPQAAEIRKMVLKIFFALTQYVLPLELLSNEFFRQWMEVCNTAILAEIPPGAMDNVDSDERPELIWWKEKKWALHIVSRIFER